jgi:hypothetical protein
MEKNYERDELRDRDLIKEAMEKHGPYQEAVKWLTKHLASKYGSEFGGTISVEYDLLRNKFILKCGKSVREFEEDEIGEIPSQIKFFRKMRVSQK